jgi:copper(I)-binding protein
MAPIAKFAWFGFRLARWCMPPVIFLVCFATEGLTKDFRLGSIEIAQPWSRATPKGAKVATGYMTIINHGPAPDRLVGGTISVGRLEIHEMSMERGIMKMRQVTGGVALPPGATVEFKPSSLHLMFQNIQRPLVKGDQVKGTLIFEKAGTIEIEYEVLGIGESRGGHGH